MKDSQVLSKPDAIVDFDQIRNLNVVLTCTFPSFVSNMLINTDELIDIQDVKIESFTRMLPDQPLGFYVISVFSSAGIGQGLLYSTAERAHALRSWNGKRHLQELPQFLRPVAADSLSTPIATAPLVTILSGAKEDKREYRDKVLFNTISQVCENVYEKKAEQCHLYTFGHFPHFERMYASRFASFAWADTSSGLSRGQLSPCTHRVAVLSGSSWLEGSIDEALSICARTRTPVVVAAQSCPTLSTYLLNYGVNAVVSEYLPLFFMDGPSRIEIRMNMFRPL